MTSECDPYTHPSNEKITFWDVPGIGTPNFPSNIKEYGKKIDIKKYDAFLFICQKRFTDNDLALVKEARSLKKPFFFIRTHVEQDVRNAERSTKKNEHETLKELRENCHKHLKEFFNKNPSEVLFTEDDIYLIDSYVRDKWDFGRLIDGIADVLPERRRDCFVLSLSNLTRNCLKRKATVLKGKKTNILTKY